MKYSIKFISIVLFFSQTSVLLAVENDLEFAEKLYGKKFYHLSSKYYEKCLKENTARDRDDVHLKLYKIYSRLSEEALDSSKSNELEKKAQSYFNKIKNRAAPMMQLEQVKSKISSLRSIKDDFANNKIVGEKQTRQKKNDAREHFKSLIKVVDKIRLDAGKYIDDYAMQKKSSAKELRKQQNLHVHSNLLFGEAVVLFTSIVGRSDPEALVWLKKMTASYSDFISNYYETAYAIVGNVYLGEANILLGEYVDDYQMKVNGVEMGMSNFSEAIAGLQELEKQHPAWAKTWVMKAYLKQTDALQQIGAAKEAVEALEHLFSWKKADSFTPKKDKVLHFQMMALLEKKCQLILELYNKGDKKILSKAYEAVNLGLNVTKRMKSPWQVNFKKILSQLPDDPSIKLTADTSFLRANNIYLKAGQLESEPAKRKMYFDAAILYKNAIGMSVEDGRQKMDQIIPQSSYKMGMCYYKMDNYILALSSFLRAVDLYPSQKYNKKDYPDIYSYIKNCAKSALACAIKRFNSYGKEPFDQELYERTLNVISEMFPEEGGDPEYHLGKLKKSSKEYSDAISEFNKVGKNSPLYPMARYHVADCQYEMMLEGKEETPETLGRSQKIFEEVLSDIKSFKLEGKTDNKQQQISAEKREEAISRVYRKMAGIYFKVGKYREARETYERILSQVEDRDEIKTAIGRMIICDYKEKDLESIAKDIKALEKLKVPGWDEKDRNEEFSKFHRLHGKLVLTLEVNENLKLLDKASKEKGATSKEFKVAEENVSKAYVKAADLFEQSLKLTENKDQEIVEMVISFYFKHDHNVNKALNLLRSYFRWFSNELKMEALYQKGIGKDPAAWDKTMGNLRQHINTVEMQELYDQFLDAIFDKIDYSKHTIVEIRDLKNETKDKPRDYRVAVEVLDEMEKKQKSDRNFRSYVLPKLIKYRDDLKQATNYYAMRYMMAQCYLRKELYEKAADIFSQLSKYYVEYFDIRIEIGKAQFAMGTEDGFKKAQKIFRRLVSIVPKPMNPESYRPLDYYSLGFWYLKTKMGLLASEKDKEKAIVEYWKVFRSMIYQDLDYFRKDAERYNRLEITLNDRPMHYRLIDDIKKYVEMKIFPVLLSLPAGHPLKNESWKTILQEI